MPLAKPVPVPAPASRIDHGEPDLWRWPSYPGQEQHDWEEPRTTQSAVGGAVDGPARRLARWRRASLKALGNAVVPQVAYLIAAGVTKAGRQ